MCFSLSVHVIQVRHIISFISLANGLGTHFYTLGIGVTIKSIKVVHLRISYIFHCMIWTCSSLSSHAHVLVQLVPSCFHVIAEAAGEDGKELFLQEIEFMKQIGSHRNVLSMLGYWVKSEPIMLILEYAPQGDLLQWLRSQRQQVRKY